jgi:hypothetical protein
MKLTREILNEMIEREMKERYGLDKNNVEVICESDKEQTPRLTREQLVKMINEIIITIKHEEGGVLLDTP